MVARGHRVEKGGLSCSKVQCPTAQCAKLMRMVFRGLADKWDGARAFVLKDGLRGDLMIWFLGEGKTAELNHFAFC